MRNITLTIVAIIASALASSCIPLLFQRQPDHAVPQQQICTTHLSDPVNPSSPKQPYQVRQHADANGFVKEYSLTLKTSICYTNVCKPIHVNLYWDMLGRFSRLECPENTPLTKDEHVFFSQDDYARLNEILKDRYSILGQYKPSFFDEKQKQNMHIDGVTSATPISVRNAVVKDAAHTSWALWHWVNGEIVGKLLDLTKQDCDAPFLEHCLRSSHDRNMVKFALHFILENEPETTQYHEAAFHILKNEGRANCTLALEYLKGSTADKEVLHKKLADLMGVNGGSERLISNYFMAQPHLSTATLEQLTEKLALLPYNEFIAVFNLLESHLCNSPVVKGRMSALLKSDDPYRVKFAQDYLEKHNQNVQ